MNPSQNTTILLKTFNLSSLLLCAPLGSVLSRRGDLDGLLGTEVEFVLKRIEVEGGELEGSERRAMVRLFEWVE